MGEFFEIKKIKTIAGRLFFRTDLVLEGGMPLARFTPYPRFPFSCSARRGNRRLLYLLYPKRDLPSLSEGEPENILAISRT